MGVIMLQCMMGGWWNEYSFKCQPVDYSNKPSTVTVSLKSKSNSSSIKYCKFNENQLRVFFTIIINTFFFVRHHCIYT